jgi:hypothetical protein
MANYRDAVEGIKDAHASLWASAALSYGTAQNVDDAMGRKIYCWGYPIATIARSCDNFEKRTVSLTSKDKILQVVDSDDLLSEKPVHSMCWFAGDAIATLGTLVGIVVAPIQLMQAHRANKLSRLDSLMKAQDAAFQAREDANHKIVLNSLAMAEMKESRQFKYVNRSFSNNVFKFKSVEELPKETIILATIVRIDNSEGDIGTYNYKVYDIVVSNNNKLEVRELEHNVNIDVEARCGVLKINRVMFSESGSLLLKPFDTRFSRDNKMEIIPCANMSFNSDESNKDTTTEQTKWATTTGGEWTKLAKRIGALNQACCLEQYPDNYRKQICATKWPAPILYAMMAMIYDADKTLLFALDDIGSLKLIGDTFNSINKAIESTLTYEIDGELCSVWQVWTNGNYSLPIGQTIGLPKHANFDGGINPNERNHTENRQSPEVHQK